MVHIARCMVPAITANRTSHNLCSLHPRIYLHIITDEVMYTPQNACGLLRYNDYRGPDNVLIAVEMCALKKREKKFMKGESII